MHYYWYHIAFVLLITAIIGCRSGSGQQSEKKSNDKNLGLAHTEEAASPIDKQLEWQDSLRLLLIPYQSLDKPVWLTELFDGHEGMRVVLAYEGSENFTGKPIYPCGRCYLHKDAAKQLLAANQYFHQNQGYHLKIFDACRPLIFQEILWKEMPDPNYLANPNQISMHSRGLAVDITLIDSFGVELDMGTPFDFFGKASYHAYEQLPESIKENRRILKEGMAKFGFSAITSEWWHYYFRRAHADPVKWVWSCEGLPNEGASQ